MAEEEGKAVGKPKKPAPPAVRIRASEDGTKVVAPVKPLETRPAHPAAAPPPLASGSSLTVEPVAAGEPAPARDEGRRAKPPPPHVQRGGAPRAPEAPAREEPPAPATVRVKPAESRAAPATSLEPTAPAGEPRAPDAGPPADPAPRPHIGTDAGRLSALSAAIALVLVVFLVEVYAGVVSRSLALFSDAGHVFMDLFSYGLAYGAVAMSQRRSSERETFGSHRGEIVAAFISGILLVIVVAVIYFEAASRLLNPPDVNLTYMLTVPLLSAAANLYLSRRFEGARDLNMRGAHLHVLSDLLSAVGVLVAGVLILATGNPVFDPLVSFFIGLLILRGAIQLLRESSEILLERTPAHLNVNEIIGRIKETPGVVGVHSVHVWSLCSSVHALSAHIVAPGPSTASAQQLLSAVRGKVEHDFGIHFTTIQVESEDCGADQHPTVAHGVAEALSHAHSHA